MKGRILLIAMVLAGAMLLTGCTEESLEESKEKAIKNIEEAQLKELSEGYKKKQKNIVDTAKKDIEKSQDIVEVKRIGDDAEYRIKRLNDLIDDALVAEIKGAKATINLNYTTRGGRVTRIKQETNIDISEFNESQKNSMMNALGQLEKRWDSVEGSSYSYHEVNNGKGIRENIDMNISIPEYYDSLQSSRLYPLLVDRKYLDIENVKTRLKSKGFTIITDNTEKENGDS